MKLSVRVFFALAMVLVWAQPALAQIDDQTPPQAVQDEAAGQERADPPPPVAATPEPIDPATAKAITEELGNGPTMCPDPKAPDDLGIVPTTLTGSCMR